MPVSSVSARLSLNVKTTLIYSPGDGQPNARIPVELLENVKLPHGEAAGEVNLCAYVRAVDVAASTNVDYDLRALDDSTGLQNGAEFASVSAIVLRNNRDTALAGLKIGPKDGANGVGILGSPAAGKGLFNAGTDRIVVPPGGFVVLYAGEAFPTSATFKDLRVSTSAVAGDVNGWDLLILGVSA